MNDLSALADCNGMKLLGSDCEEQTAITCDDCGLAFCNKHLIATPGALVCARCVNLTKLAAKTLPQAALQLMGGLFVGAMLAFAVSKLLF